MENLRLAFANDLSRTPIDKEIGAVLSLVQMPCLCLLRQIRWRSLSVRIEPAVTARWDGIDELIVSIGYIVDQDLALSRDRLSRAQLRHILYGCLKSAND